MGICIKARQPQTHTPHAGKTKHTGAPGIAQDTQLPRMTAPTSTSDSLTRDALGGHRHLGQDTGPKVPLIPTNTSLLRQGPRPINTRWHTGCYPLVPTCLATPEQGTGIKAQLLAASREFSHPQGIQSSPGNSVTRLTVLLKGKRIFIILGFFIKYYFSLVILTS